SLELREAITQAVRFPPSSSDSSPKKSPGPRRFTRRLGAPAQTSSSPRRQTKKVSPSSPSLQTVSPRRQDTSTNRSAIASRSARSRPPNSGTPESTSRRAEVVDVSIAPGDTTGTPRSSSLLRTFVSGVRAAVPVLDVVHDLHLFDRLRPTRARS